MSQYEAHLRAILDLPIPEDSLDLVRPAVMLNILGGRSPEAHLEVAKKALPVVGANVHLYGKGSGTPGRKMGHINNLGINHGQSGGTSSTTDSSSGSRQWQGGSDIDTGGSSSGEACAGGLLLLWAQTRISRL